MPLYFTIAFYQNRSQFIEKLLRKHEVPPGYAEEAPKVCRVDAR